MKKIRIGIILSISLFSLLGIMLFFVSGSSQIGGVISTDRVFKAYAGIDFEGDMTSEEAETALQGLLNANEDYSKLEATWPYTVEELGDFLESEKATYGNAVIRGYVRHFRTEEEYEYESGEGYSLESSFKWELPSTMQDVYDQKEAEYPFRVPWQLLAASRYIFKEPVEQDLYESVMPDYVYGVPYMPYNSPVLSNGTAVLEGETIQLDNHIFTEKNSLYVPVTDDYQPLASFPADGTGNYNRVNGIEETRTVKTVTTKWYKRDSDGKIKSTKTDKQKNIIRDVSVELATPRPLITRSMYGDNHFVYKREQIPGEVIEESYDVDYYYDSDHRVRKRVTTRIQTVLTSDRMVLDEENITPDKTMYMDFFEDQGYKETDAVFMLNLMSLQPGASESASLLGAGFQDENVLYVRSDMSRSTYDYIHINPSELDLPIPRFFQNDSRWVSLPFGSSTVGRAGCGPTSAAMVITGLTGSVITPPEMCDIAYNGGFKTSKGISWAFFGYAANKFGLEMVELSPTAQGNQTMLNMLSAGNPVIVSMHAGHFTSGGHIIVLTGITADGKIEVNDPYDPYMTKNRAWNPAIILDEANEYFVIKNPAVAEAETGGTDEDT